jgi:hypothetical protein
MVLALLLSGGITSCFAAIANARALECCSKDCPRPARNPSECCSVGISTQDGEVAPAIQLNNAGSSAFSLAMVPVSAIFTPSRSPQLSIPIAHWSPPPRLIRSALCSLQI